MSDEGSDGGEVYEVEKILDKRTKKGKTEYFIKWKGGSVVLIIKTVIEISSQATMTRPRIPGSQLIIWTVTTKFRTTRKS